MRLPFMLLLLLLIPACPAEVYKWIDADGRVQFGDRPPPGVEAATVEIKVNTYQSPSLQVLEAALQADRKVVMYSASWCPVCKQAKRYFRDQRIDYTEYDIETSARGKRDFETLGGGGVPIILVGRQRLNGFSEASFESVYAAFPTP